MLGGRRGLGMQGERLVPVKEGLNQEIRAGVSGKETFEQSQAEFWRRRVPGSTKALRWGMCGVIEEVRFGTVHVLYKN